MRQLIYVMALVAIVGAVLYASTSCVVKIYRALDNTNIDSNGNICKYTEVGSYEGYNIVRIKTLDHGTIYLAIREDGTASTTKNDVRCKIKNKINTITVN